MAILEFLASLVPTSTEVETGTVTAVCGSLVAYLCGWDDALEALLVLMALDYATGLIAAYVNPQLRLDSRKGFRGICKKVLILAVIALAHFATNVAGGGEAVRMLAVWFFVGNEGLSIIENAANAGVPVPEKLRKTLEQFRDEKKERCREEP